MSTLPLPATAAEQCVLSFLQAGEWEGRDLHHLLVNEGHKMSLPSFYTMMAKLEDASLVYGWWIPEVIAGQRILKRKYRLAQEK